MFIPRRLWNRSGVEDVGATRNIGVYVVANPLKAMWEEDRRYSWEGRSGDLRRLEELRAWGWEGRFWHLLRKAG